MVFYKRNVSKRVTIFLSFFLLAGSSRCTSDAVSASCFTYENQGCTHALVTTKLGVG